MTPRVSSARARMVETTKNLLRTQGYNGTGLNQIIEESHAPKGSLYHFFPGGKEHLAEEAVRQGAAEVEQMIHDALKSAPSVAAGLTAVVQYIIEELRTSDFQRGCPISTVALETAGTRNPLQSACSTAFESIQAVIEQALQREGRSAEQSHALANLILCAYEGALMLSRTHHDTRPLEEMVVALGPFMSKR